MKNKKTLIGPFSQMVTLSGLPLKGPLKDNQLDVISHAGLLIQGEKIIGTGNFDQIYSKIDKAD